ncbi:class I SAM-dependent methyltransferase [Actinomadura opuntiae]|uniref:class I SAM-dependent methyltransferase n=1 Tax=Actinomadura sp. OS1-43 TaxID=604315 RepID=UPI00255B323B|nr:class I SAM-dependent methyltransferase [Actinomadura sp. OS1-43]MDL4820660.1 class I SAM-dependent methyltransferase [Actinomadura sp. OS1-43]
MKDAFPDSEPGLVARRASSFGGSAAAYARERPDYPDAAVTWALEPVAGRTPLRVLDLAAGTGKLTQVLVRNGVEAGRLVAVEPDAAMLDELRRAAPGVRALEGSAEAIPLPDGAVDAVLVGQAMHWFDLDRALPEIHRVLADGGVLAGLWNTDDDRVPWVAELKRISRSSVSFRNWRPKGLPESDWFPAFERAEFPHAQRRTAESMAATIGTHSHMLVLDEPERAAVTERIIGYLRATPETADGEFDLPIVTLVARARRAGA